MNRLMEELKAYFSAEFIYNCDGKDGGCETCGHGGTEYMTLETIRNTIDNFVKEVESADSK